MTFQRVRGLELVFYADAAFAPKETKRKSVAGGAVICWGAAIQSISRTQKCTTFSSREAEYVANADGLKEALFLRSVWRFFSPNFRGPYIQVFGDNNGAIEVAVNPTRHHFLREHVENGVFEISHVQSKNQHAEFDFLTKRLAKDAFLFHRNFIRNMRR